jgi:hypothetical protein
MFVLQELLSGEQMVLCLLIGMFVSDVDTA